MRYTVIQHRALTILTFLLLPFFVVGQSSRTLYVQIDYMKPNPGMEDDYIWMENTIFKPLHTQRIRNGEIAAWYLYEVQYPGGDDAEYNYVTITMYNSFASMDDETVSFDDLVKSVHPTRTPEEVSGLTNTTRRLVKSEAFKSDIRFPTVIETPPRTLLIDYMKVEPTNNLMYVKLENEIWRPLHQERFERDLISTWGMYELLYPGGVNYPYSHATATGFDSWGMIVESWPEDLWEQVHPNSTREELEQRAHSVRALVSSQIWRLIDFTISAEN